ncbi:RDD family protein [Kordia sp. YSTF-M3]|uniref:RDD family protein n=1 Tax=Kordia aestuariivivens TaxID=2759037 RepID=A0ABR7Q5V3_9FLAO|nr:RDD family protein [Kordia aestuariivivens]MBC8753818.1 RDD family protein [Kordia aestuariivivens]
MSEIQINTTQNVNINFTLASVGERVVAHIIDLVIKGAYASTVIWIIVSMQSSSGFMRDWDDWSIISVFVLALFPFIFYTLVLESIFEGQTIGKKAMKIRVVKIDGYQASFVDYLIRWFFRIIDLNMLSGFIALISVIVSEKAQRLGDMTAGTAVISLKNKVLISHTILEEIGDNYKPLYPSVIRLSDNDMRIIKETYLIAKRAKDFDTLTKLRTKVEQVIEAKSQQETIPFLGVIIKDYNFYTQNM